MFGLEAQVAGDLGTTGWLLLIHRIPKDPAYLRVKVGRRLSAVGAVALKNSVYLLPNRESCREDFSWIRREVVDGGGEATVFQADAVEGSSNALLERTFREARAADYVELQQRIAALERTKNTGTPPARQAALAELARIEERTGEIERIDYFAQHEARAARARLAVLREKLEVRASEQKTPRAVCRRKDFAERTWVTRAGVKVDRLACAWLIRRFIDTKAKFRFVDAAHYEYKPGEVRFDMSEAEFTHEADLCSFEVLCQRFALTRSGLVRIGEIVHDLDIKDGRHGRPETEGVRVVLDGIISQRATDLARVEAASTLFDALLAADHSSTRGRTR